NVLQTPSVVQTPNVLQPPVQQPGERNQGHVLLEKARLELRSGELGVARRLVEEAIRGPYNVRDEAMTVLRSIDAEESAQNVRTAGRTFDLGAEAFNKRDSGSAYRILAGLDAHLLDEDRQLRFREIMMSPEMQPNLRGGPLVRVGALEESTGRNP